MKIDNASDITVTGWDKKTTSIEIYKKGPEAELINFAFDETSSGALIKGWMLENEIRRLRADIVMNVPRSINLEITAFRSESKIHIRDVKGKVKITSVDDVNLQNVSGEIAVTTSGENITLNDVKGFIELTRSGTIATRLRLQKFSTLLTDRTIEQWPISYDPIPGNIQVSLAADAGTELTNVELTSDAGDIALVVPEKLSMKFNIELVHTKDAEKTFDIASDYDIEKEELDTWNIIHTPYVKWIDSDDNRYTVYGKWADNTQKQIIPLYKERKIRKDEFETIMLDNIKGEAGRIAEKITPVEISEKTIIGTGVIAGGNHKINIKTRNGNVYLKKRERS